MTVARSVADVLTDHVVFEVECIDRMYLNVYVPGLQYEAGLVHVGDQPGRVLQAGHKDVEIHPVDALHLEHHMIGKDISDGAG